jgi:hypothetical protein
VSKVVSDAVLDGLETEASHRPATIAEFLARLGLADVVGSASPPRTQHAPLVPSPSMSMSSPSLPPPPPPIAPVPAVVSGRSKVIGPALVTVAALGATLPTVTFTFLALVALPALATVGDALIFMRMRRLGDRMHWRHRAALPPYVPVRFVRNIGHVVYTAVPAFLVAAVTIALALLLNATMATFTAEAWVLRVGGALSAVLLTVPVFRDRVRFRAAVIEDRVLARALETDGTLTSFGLSVWIVAALVLAIAVGLRPDPWPFGG